MIGNEQPDVLICMKVSNCSDPVDGATVEKCSQCGEKVWVSPASQEMRKNTILEIWCEVCVKTHLSSKCKVVTTTAHVAEAMEYLKSRRLGGRN